MSRNLWAGIAAVVVVAAVIVLGFRNIGGPREQRQIHQDNHTVYILSVLAGQVDNAWNTSGKVLPADLGRFPDNTRNPTTHAPFIYRPKGDRQYELCTTFLTDTTALNEHMFWAHPKGNYCFQFDASVAVAQTPYDDAY